MSLAPFDADHPPPLDFERWADLSAQLLGREPDERLERLERAELDPDLWDACNGFWVAELAAQIARGNLKLAQRYGRACADELARRKLATEAPTERAANADETAFLVALPDDTAIPFAKGRPPPPRAPSALPPPHPAAGDTLVAGAVAFEAAVPFDRR